MTKIGRISKTLGAFALVSTLAACGSTQEEEAPATEVSEEQVSVIEERQQNFETMGDAFMAIRDEFEGDSPDMELVAASAQTIDEAAQKVGGLFPEGTGMDSGAETEALAVIWEQPEDFAAAVDRLTVASAGLVEAVASGDGEAIGSASRELGGSCKNCHDTFRLDDE